MKPLSPTRCALFSAIVLLSTGCANRLAPYRGGEDNLLVGEPATEAPPITDGVRVTYLGTNGYLIESPSTAILVDPYFSRIDLRRVLFNAPTAPSADAITYASRQARLPDRVDGFLVTHSHFDHLFDVPALQRQLGGKIVTSPTGTFLSMAAGVADRDVVAALPGRQLRVGDASIRVLPARHDRVLGVVPYPGTISEPLVEPPTRPKDWRLGTPLAFLIELNGKRIYVESGGVAGHPPPNLRVDLAILGTAVGDSRHYAEAVRALRPRFVLPSHQDNFFKPLEKGFHFSAVSNFPKILATHKSEGFSADLVLMDYFHAWQLP